MEYGFTPASRAATESRWKMNTSIGGNGAGCTRIVQMPSARWTPSNATTPAYHSHPRPHATTHAATAAPAAASRNLGSAAAIPKNGPAGGGGADAAAPPPPPHARRAGGTP